VLTPARRATPEWLDDPATGADVAVRSGEDIARCNRWLGGRRALVAQFAPLWATLPRRITVLDLASGVGDLAAAVVAAGVHHGVEVETIALDRRAELLHHAATRGARPLCADAGALPFPTDGVDVVICGQFLHHLEDPAIAALVQECTRIARHAVLIADLRRSWLAAAGFWLLSFPLRLHVISRHDGVASVLKGFTRRELAAVLSDALDRPIAVAERPLFRLTASWTPARA
jgi:ubiquinone/menaquinone biosynthesis C-methylase UbiE